MWSYEKPILIKDEIVDIEVENPIGEDENYKEHSKRRKFEELTDEEQLIRLKRMAKTRLETKWKLLRLVDTNYDKRTSFLTITTKENVQSRDEFTMLFEKFIKRFNYQVYNSKKAVLRYLAVLEQQARGAFHAHILLFSCPYIPHKELLAIWGHGSVRINKLGHLDDSSNAGRYVVKYMEKGIGQGLLENFGKKSYLASRNLKKPEENKIFSKEPLEFDDSLVLYETEYNSKIYRDGRLIDNPVRYRKIKLSEDKLDK